MGPAPQHWISNGAGSLLGCGVDAESPARFQKLLSEERPWPLVYSEREASRIRRMRDPALGYCASFCCKEAAIKALEDPFPLPHCEFVGDLAAPSVRLAGGLARGRGVAASEARLFGPHAGELVSVVLLGGAGPARGAHAVLELLPLEEVERDPAALSNLHLTAGEAAEVAPRRLQTLAGFLAVKRALCRLFSRLPGGCLARTTDFVLTHRPSGAPCLAAAPPHPAGRIFVSLSHTRACAYGLAVFQEAWDAPQSRELTPP